MERLLVTSPDTGERMTIEDAQQFILGKALDYDEAQRWREAIDVGIRAEIEANRGKPGMVHGVPWSRSAVYVREMYQTYLQIAHILLQQVQEAVATEHRRIHEDLVQTWEDEEATKSTSSKSYVPRPAIARDLLENLQRCLSYILDQGKALERYHRLGDGVCLECGKRLPPGKRLYCSRKCTNVYTQRRYRARAWKEHAEKYNTKAEDEWKDEETGMFGKSHYQMKSNVIDLPPQPDTQTTRGRKRREGKV
jgi:hypothetical protein